MFPILELIRDGREIKLAHRLNHLRNLTIPKPFLETVALNYPAGDRIVTPQEELRVTLPFHQRNRKIEESSVEVKRNNETTMAN